MILRSILGFPTRAGCDHEGCDATLGIVQFLQEWKTVGWGCEVQVGEGVRHLYHYCEVHAVERGCTGSVKLRQPASEKQVP